MLGHRLARALLQGKHVRRKSPPHGVRAMKLTEFAWPNPSRPRWVKASAARIEGNLVEVAARAYGQLARVTVFPDPVFLEVDDPAGRMLRPG